MKYKEGNKVRIKVLDERERYHKDLSYVYEMVKYQGQIHQITKVDTQKKEYGIVFSFLSPDDQLVRQTWYYKEEWLEDCIEYEAF